MENILIIIPNTDYLIKYCTGTIINNPNLNWKIILKDDNKESYFDTLCDLLNIEIIYLTKNLSDWLYDNNSQFHHILTSEDYIKDKINLLDLIENKLIYIRKNKQDSHNIVININKNKKDTIYQLSNMSENVISTSEYFYSSNYNGFFCDYIPKSNFESDFEYLNIEVNRVVNGKIIQRSLSNNFLNSLSFILNAKKFRRYYIEGHDVLSNKNLYKLLSLFSKNIVITIKAGISNDDLAKLLSFPLYKIVISITSINDLSNIDKVIKIIQHFNIKVDIIIKNKVRLFKKLSKILELNKIYDVQIFEYRKKLHFKYLYGSGDLSYINNFHNSLKITMEDSITEIIENGKVNPTNFVLNDKIYVLLSCNDKNIYYWPYVKEKWIEMGFNPVLFYVTNSEKGFDDDVHIIPPVLEVSVDFQAIMAKLYFTKIYHNNYCMICNIETLPINRDYYLNNLLSSLNSQNIISFVSNLKTPSKYYYGNKYSIDYGIVSMGSNLKSLINKDNLSYKDFMVKTAQYDTYSQNADEIFISTMINLSDYLVISLKREIKKVIINDIEYTALTKSLDRNYWKYNEYNFPHEINECRLLKPFNIYQNELNKLFNCLNMQINSDFNVIDDKNTNPLDNPQSIMIIITNPGDEVLLCGGTIINSPNIRWKVVYLTTSNNDVLNDKFRESCKKLNVDYEIITFQDETNDLESYQYQCYNILELLSKQYDAIMTYHKTFIHDKFSKLLSVTINKLTIPKIFFNTGINKKDLNLGNHHIFSFKINRLLKEEIYSLYCPDNSTINSHRNINNMESFRYLSKSKIFNEYNSYEVNLPTKLIVEFNSDTPNNNICHLCYTNEICNKLYLIKSISNIDNIVITGKKIFSNPDWQKILTFLSNEFSNLSIISDGYLNKKLWIDLLHYPINKFIIKITKLLDEKKILSAIKILKSMNITTLCYLELDNNNIYDLLNKNQIDIITNEYDSGIFLKSNGNIEIRF